MRQKINEVTRDCGEERSVSEILSRSTDGRKVFPPDFVHGNAVVADIYAAMGRRWVERALFVVDDGAVMTRAWFDDYFLVVDHWLEDRRPAFQEWWYSRVSEKNRIVATSFDASSRVLEQASIDLQWKRKRLHRLEREILGVVREAGCRGVNEKRRIRRGEIDMLSMVTLVGRLSSDHIRDAARGH